MKARDALPTNMFIGRYQHTIDPKGRVSIPARYRNALAQYEGNLIVVPEDDCLNVYPFEAWERLVSTINEQSRFDEEIRKLGRLWISLAREAELDSAGRVLLPPDSRQRAGLVKDVTLVGIGREFFEVWDRGRFEEYERMHGDGLRGSYARLSQLGVK
jgi:MraZ protein